MRHGMKPIDPKAQGSFRGSFKRKRGLFIEIRDHHCASLRRTYVPDPADDEFEISMDTKSQAQTFARLFPNCTTDSPAPADIEELCERFRIATGELGDDRNKNRAHALEGDAGLAKMLWLPELTTLFDRVEELLEDLSLVSEGASFGGDNLNHADCTKTAADIVDLILLGNINDVRRLTAKRTRDELYARLHDIDDAATASKNEHHKVHFNDRQFGEPFEDWMIHLAANGP
jgi:hypothetical protein